MLLANNATGFLGSLLDIVNFIFTNSAGIVAGLLVGGIICLFLIGRIPKWLMAIIAIACSVVGMFISSIFTSKGDTTAENLPTASDIEKELSSTIIDGWKNTNGGFTFEQIITAQSDEECPSYNDQVIRMDCQEYGDYVCFYYANGNIFENAVFLKTDKGLVYDGLLCATGDFETKSYLVVTQVFTDKWSWAFEKSNKPYYYEKTTIKPNIFGLVGAVANAHKYNDLVSVSSQTPSYLRFNHNLEIGCGEVQAEALRQGARLAGSNITSKFVKFGSVELVAEKDKSQIAINNFYNYLYNSIKSKEYGSRAMIDTTGLTCLPIPKDEQKNYPVSDKFKDKYQNIDYYAVYRCNIAVDLGYEQGNKELTTNNKVDQYIKDNADKDSLKVEEIETKQELSQIAIKFVDTGKSDLTNLDLLKNPIKIKFSSAELNESKILLINSKEMLTKANNVLLTKNAEWKFVIESNAVVIEDYIGTIKPVANKYDYSINYYYAHNHVLASVGLNPVGSIDSSLIDLSNYPVKIQLKNDKNTYTFTFDSNDELNKYQSQMVEMGEYSYTILSSQLEFASSTGTLTITNTDRTMLFNYILKEITESYDFNIEIAKYPDSTSYENGTNPVLIFRDATLFNDTIKDYYNNVFCDSFYIQLNIYRKESGIRVYGLSHTFNNSSSDPDPFFNIRDELTNGVEYVVQMSFYNIDSDMIFMSNPIEYTFEDNSTFILKLV